MSRLSYSHVSSHDYDMERSQRYRASQRADEYREKYLELRKAMREYFRDNGIVPTDEIKKMIGEK